MESSSTTFSASATMGNNSSPTLLGLPREVRNQIYGYFVTIDRSAEFIPSLDFQNHLDPRSFGVNRQIRQETLMVLKPSKLWIHLVITPGDIQAAASLFGSLVQHQEGLFTLGHTDQASISEDATLRVAIELRCDRSDKDPLTQPYPKISFVLFPYSKRTYTNFCHALLANTESYERLGISIRPSSTLKGLKRN
jgi:hypothetical protein